MGLRGLLTSQSSLIAELYACERPCLIKQGRGWEKTAHLCPPCTCAHAQKLAVQISLHMSRCRYNAVAGSGLRCRIVSLTLELVIVIRGCEVYLERDSNSQGEVTGEPWLISIANVTGWSCPPWPAFPSSEWNPRFLPSTLPAPFASVLHTTPSRLPPSWLLPVSLYSPFLSLVHNVSVCPMICSHVW